MGLNLDSDAQRCTTPADVNGDEWVGTDRMIKPEKKFSPYCVPNHMNPKLSCTIVHRHPTGSISGVESIAAGPRRTLWIENIRSRYVDHIGLHDWRGRRLGVQHHVVRRSAVVQGSSGCKGIVSSHSPNVRCGPETSGFRMLLPVALLEVLKAPLQDVGYPTIGWTCGTKSKPLSRNIEFFPMSMRCRRLDDRIRELCAKVAATEDPDELKLILTELKSAIHQMIERLRIRAVTVLSGRRDFPNERRQTLLNV